MTAMTTSTIGVVICAYTSDRWELLQRAVRSVEHQGQESRIAVVVDHNDELLDRARREWPVHHVLANRFERGLSGARNTGVAALDTDIIAFLDDDAAAHDNWLGDLVAPFGDETVGLVGGRVEPEWSLGRPAWFPVEFAWVVGCSYRGLPTEPADVRNPIGASMAVRRAVFDAVGLFQHGIGRVGNLPLGCEETELAIRAAAVGYRCRFQPSSVVSHHVTADRHRFGYFIRRCRAEGQSKAVVARLTETAAALDSERSYLLRTIPSGLLHCVRDLGSRSAISAIARAGAMVAGCVVTAAAYGTGTFHLTISQEARQLPRAPRLSAVEAAGRATS